MSRFVFLLTFGLIGCAILVGLGTWQMQRLAWKEAILARIDARISAPPEALPERPDPEADAYLPVRMTGTILPGELHVLVSRKGSGAGYRIVSPFLTEDGRRVLLDRGYVRASDREAVRAAGPAEIEGNLHWPQETDRFTPAPDIAGNTWFARDVPAMAAVLDTEPVMVVARAPAAPGLAPMPVDSAAIPNDHLQYAITWFSLALIWAGMTLHFLRRPQRKG